MRILKVKNYDEMSKKAAAVIAAQIVAKPDSVLGLATGSTPIGTYQYLTVTGSTTWSLTGEIFAV